jgi:hypothetical protein
MDTLEYRKLISVLDQEIEQAKQQADVKAKREALEGRKNLCLHWIAGLDSRKAELEKFGGRSTVPIDLKLAEVRKELEAVEREIAGGPAHAAPAPAAGVERTLPPGLTPCDRAELSGLIAEIEAKQDLLDLPHDERWLVFQMWACRYRIIANRAGEAACTHDHSFRSVYGAILRKKEEMGKGPFLEGLRDPRAGTDWEERLRGLKNQLSHLESRREAAETGARAQTEALSELTLFLRGATPTTEPELRTLRHLVRHAASFETLREEVSPMVMGLREPLGSGFEFLFENGKPEPEEPKSDRSHSNAEIVSRILRRLKAKAMIGACHAPMEMIAKGFAGHDYGRADEALGVLVKAGLIRRRQTGIGYRVSLEPPMMGAIELGISCAKTGIAVLDEWTDGP